jgi:hypothetical protein
MCRFLAALAACWLLPVVPNGGHPPELAEVFEHVINPEDGEETLISGARVVVVHDGVEAQQRQRFSTERSSP